MSASHGHRVRVPPVTNQTFSTGKESEPYRLFYSILANVPPLALLLNPPKITAKYAQPLRGRIAKNDRQKKIVFTNPESFKEENDLQESVNQAIGNTEVLWPMIQELQAKVADLEKRTSDLEAEVRDDD